MAQLPKIKLRRADVCEDLSLAKNDEVIRDFVSRLIDSHSTSAIAVRALTDLWQLRSVLS